jgi:hypothetical protein
MVLIAAIRERHQEPGIGDCFHDRENPFLEESSAGPLTVPANLKNNCFSAARARSSC